MAKAVLTAAEKAAKWDAQAAKAAKYYETWKARQRVLARKIKAAKITVSKEEIEAEMKK